MLQVNSSTKLLHDMKPLFRLFRRGEIYYSVDTKTGEQKCLGTTDKGTAQQLLRWQSECVPTGTCILQVPVSLLAPGPDVEGKTWKDLIDVRIENTDAQRSRCRWEYIRKHEIMLPLWKLKVVQTGADQLLTLLERGPFLASDD
jgi:hypothetical protein